MSFEQSGLPQNALLREVYDYAHERVMRMRDRVVRDNMRQLEENYRGNLANLKDALASGSITEEKYGHNLQRIEQWYNAKKQGIPPAVEGMLKQKFLMGHVRFAVEVSQVAEGISSEALAVALIGDSVASARDYMEIETRFGPVVAGIARDTQHVRLYPESGEEVMTGAHPDARRLWLAREILLLEHLGESLVRHREMAPTEDLMYSPTEMEVYMRVRPVLGTDKKMDRRLVDAFNKVAHVIDATHRLEFTDQGEIHLHQTPRQIQPPKRPPIIPPGGGGGGNGGIGPNIFG